MTVLIQGLSLNFFSGYASVAFVLCLITTFSFSGAENGIVFVKVVSSFSLRF